ncbi:MBL fold metallo-hydrolase [Mucilaginibacter rubeus]|uniref:MBL fold metallo-hydrolase n=1 Tax=Mucilaginibacter rubeus TaxID=2027860 RepID=A0AAE6JBI4_9SPHI|nr:MULTISPECIES: MBL fold metallo-hydrolase [Mucilaginibacter]QEM02288.1 MBL fold metallo-hydrolase [Mucilaginibacter rubeus]QEM14914.1 MBL fold metallo-hydrolase [Mucilaginibacter gossypii]QTE42371.1 MBL fold metallo-hydrolase [Mucilaginibacter rubeus]QTE48972.1 MBL fold metallo-hydrolase [Mucilaginibacter rubeus]QTE54070.1 MBL fold metallo-hydrolase [Mucilaginibacter rubeus]
MESRRNFLRTGALFGAACLTSPLIASPLVSLDPRQKETEHPNNIDHYSEGNLFFLRVFDPTLAQTSYVVGNRQSNEAIVIDPKRDIDTYLKIAEDNNLKITRVTETHIHADYLSGAPELAFATGAKLILSGETDPNWKYEIPHNAIKDGDKIAMGNIILEAMHTPGHTPESLTYLLTDLSVSNKPQKALTGDFIFVGDVGRPDLLEKVAGQVGSQDTGAKQLYASIQRFSKLPDDLEIWPAHGAGSFCGKSLSDEPHSTLKHEKLTSKAFQFANDEKGFVKYILDGQPEPPKYFATMKQWNRIPRPLLVEVPKRHKLSTSDFLTAQKNGLTIVDTRKLETVAKGHIPNSLHIEGNKSFSTFMGWLLNYQTQYVLIADESEMEDLTRKLMRIGMDNIYGFVISLNKMNVALEKSDLVNIGELKKYLNKKDVQIIDVRTESEYDNGHIKGVENIVLTTLEKNIQKISKDKPVIVHCQSGVRAAMAYSILKRNGIKNLSLYLGGINEWTEQNNELTR